MAKAATYVLRMPLAAKVQNIDHECHTKRHFTSSERNGGKRPKSGRVREKRERLAALQTSKDIRTETTHISSFLLSQVNPSFASKPLKSVFHDAAERYVANHIFSSWHNKSGIHGLFELPHSSSSVSLAQYQYVAVTS